MEELFISPSLSQHYTEGPDGQGKPYKPDPSCTSRPGRYPAVIVPRQLVGKVIKIDVQEAPAAASGSGAKVPEMGASPMGPVTRTSGATAPAGSPSRMTESSTPLPAETAGVLSDEDALRIPADIARCLKRVFVPAEFHLNDEDYQEIVDLVLTVLRNKGCQGCDHDSWDGEAESHDCNLPEGEKCPRGFDV